jgi:hypothetical protein
MSDPEQISDEEEETPKQQVELIVKTPIEQLTNEETLNTPSEPVTETKTDIVEEMAIRVTGQKFEYGSDIASLGSR